MTTIPQPAWVGRPPTQHTPFKDVAYRVKRARYLYAVGRRPRPWDDPWVRRALGLLRLRPGRRVPTDLAAVGAAFALDAAGGLLRAHLRARLLAAESFAAAEEKCGLTSGTAQAYHQLLYDVQPRMHSSTRIVRGVIGLRGILGIGPGEPEKLLLLYAYAGGPVVLDTLLPVLSRPPRPLEDYAGMGLAELPAALHELNIRTALLIRVMPLSAFMPNRLQVWEELCSTLRRLKELLGPVHTGLELPDCSELAAQLASVGQVLGQAEQEFGAVGWVA
jgi:hypothetical protein